MSILNLNSPQGRAPRGGKTTKIWLGVGLLVAVLGIGSTLAANITLNGGQATEFGQGVQSTAYCGGNAVTLTVTPFSTYSNSGAGSFSTSSFKISGIPVSCSDTDFNISFYDTATATPKTMVSGSPSLVTATVAWFDTSTVSPTFTAASTTPVFPIAHGYGSAFRTDSWYYGTSCDGNDHMVGSATGHVTYTGALLSNSNISPSSDTCKIAYVSNVLSDGGSGNGGSFVINFNSSYTLLASTSLVKIVVTSQNEAFSPGNNLKPCTFSSPTWTCSSFYGLTAASTPSA